MDPSPPAKPPVGSPHAPTTPPQGFVRIGPGPVGPLFPGAPVARIDIASMSQQMDIYALLSDAAQYPSPERDGWSEYEDFYSGERFAILRIVPSEDPPAYPIIAEEILNGIEMAETERVANPDVPIELVFHITVAFDVVAENVGIRAAMRLRATGREHLVGENAIGGALAYEYEVDVDYDEFKDRVRECYATQTVDPCLILPTRERRAANPFEINLPLGVPMGILPTMVGM